MIHSKKLLAAAVALSLSLPLTAVGQEPADDQKLVIHHVKVKIGHGPAFRDGMAAYAKCLADSNHDEGYSVWSSVDGDRTAYHIVTDFDKWAEFDSSDEVSDACWEKDGIRAGIFDHMASWKTHYAERMPGWSGNAEGYEIVRLHYFRVDDGEDFRETVGTMVGHLREAEYADLGTWYDVQATGHGAADFFYVDHFENFAAMDDRKSVDAALREAVGDDDTDELWEDFNDSLQDEKGYWAVMIKREAAMGYAPDDD